MTKKQKTRHPSVPTVPDATWKALLAAADEFNHLAPWEWMHDSDVVGMRHPATKEVLLSSVLGRLKTMFALLVYRNDAGRRWLLNTILNDGDPGGLEDEDSAFEQDLVKVEFVLKRELAKEDKAVLSAAGFDAAKKRGHVWPQFRSLAPGGYPWHLTQAEAEVLLYALPRVAAVARLLKAHPSMWDDRCEGEICFLPDDFEPAAGELRADDVNWLPMIAPPEPTPESISLDEATVERLSELSQAKGFHLELDLAYAPFPVADEDRPRFPKLAMAVDRASGFIGGFHLSDSEDRDGAGALGAVFENAVTQLGHRPEAILVQRPRVEMMVNQIASQLGIPVVPDVELDQLNEARRSMEQRFG